MIINNDFETHNLLGVGIGPFNLSLAALLSPIPGIDSKFFDARDSFIWHAGQLLPDAEIQVSHLKDLVTLVDPTNPHSFLAYLRKHKRLYRFLNGKFTHVLRKEFSQYFNWVSQSLPNLHFGEAVQDLQFKKSHFVMQTTKRIIKGKHLSLGSGLAANVPPCAKPHLGDTVFHVKDFLMKGNHWNGKRIAVIGGGQSGAEIVQALIADDKNLPTSVSWISSRDHFAPMDESVFANELFTPNYSNFFFGLDASTKAQLIKQQTLASDGISNKLLDAIYQRLYYLECIQLLPQVVHFLSNHQLESLHSDNGSHQLVLTQQLGEATSVVEADIVILCTGYKWQFPGYLSGLTDKIHLVDGHFVVNEDFSIEWDGPSDNKIFVQNAARHSHGVADPNLSLMSWRSATIINSIAGEPIYDLEGESSAMNWHALKSGVAGAKELVGPSYASTTSVVPFISHTEVSATWKT
jgi:lysine N6-hydroxylase